MTGAMNCFGDKRVMSKHNEGFESNPMWVIGAHSPDPSSRSLPVLVMMSLINSSAQSNRRCQFSCDLRNRFRDSYLSEDQPFNALPVLQSSEELGSEWVQQVRRD
jgi:hypothetical protein